MIPNTVASKTEGANVGFDTPMKLSRLPLRRAAAGLLFSACVWTAAAAQQVVIIGDSLSKEYEYELLGIGGNQDAIGTRNWCEILDEHRHEEFDFGGSGTHADLRLIGHKYNWSVPGSTADDWRNDYLTDNFQSEYVFGIPELKSQLRNDAERVVVFLGGNDIREQYGALYDGSRSPESFANSLYADLEAVVNWVLSHKRSSAQMVLVNLPHLGATPNKNDAHPYDPVKTGRVSAALESVNTRLEALALAKGIGYADVYSPMVGLVTADYLGIGGVSIFRYPPRSDGNTRYAFLGDGLHPNMPVQARFAQIILDAFNAKYDAGIPPLTDQEVLTKILKIRPEVFFEEWAQSFSLPAAAQKPEDDPDGDGIPNLLEYALNLNPAQPDRQALPGPAAAGEPVASLTFTPRPAVDRSPVTVTAEQSGNLQQWTPVAPEHLQTGADGAVTARVPLPAGGTPLFLRLKAVWPR